ncbi:MAG: hypothetical protein ACD_59C00094G0001, partial [uncultured bacterium]
MKKGERYFIKKIIYSILLIFMAASAAGCGSKAKNDGP